MTQSTEGIIFRTINYSDSNIIAKIYTRHFGLQSYMVRGARSKKSKVKANLLQPMTQVQIEVSQKGKSNIHTINELHCHKPYHSMPFDVVKNSILIFINEILYKAIKEEEQNENLFDFIQNSLDILDLKEEEYANFHLLFMLQLSRYLGFHPQGIYADNTPVFNLQDGIFVSSPPLHPYYIESSLAFSLYKMLNLGFDTLSNSVISGASRQDLLKTLLIYYELHLSGFKDVRSHLVLEEVIR